MLPCSCINGVCYCDKKYVANVTVIDNPNYSRDFVLVLWFFLAYKIFVGFLLFFRLFIHHFLCLAV